MKGLVIKSPWIDLILRGEKTWEIRGNPVRSIRGPIYLIKSGTGLVLGTVNLIDCKELSFEEYQQSQAFHCIPDCSQRPYKNIHAWVLEDPVLFKEPIPYIHPQGAVIWVNLPDLTLKGA